VNDVVLVIILILGGMAMILAEICTPSFGVLALVAMACFVYAVITGLAISPVLGFVLVVMLLIGLPIYMGFLIRFFPKTPLGKRLALRDRKIDIGAGVPQAGEEAGLIGAEGVTITVLRPSGTVSINEHRIVATAETGFLPAGARVKVIKTTGMNVVVRAAEQHTNAQ